MKFKIFGILFVALILFVLYAIMHAPPAYNADGSPVETPTQQ